MSGGELWLLLHPKANTLIYTWGSETIDWGGIITHFFGGRVGLLGDE